LGAADISIDREHFWDEWEALLQAAASVAPPRPLSHSEHWRYPDLATLIDVLDVDNAPLDGIYYALTTDQALLTGWLKAVAGAAGLDLPGISAQAQAALQSWPAGSRDIMYVMFAPPSAPAPRCDPARLDPDDVNLLIEALGAASEWLAQIAYEILLPARNPDVARRVAAELPQMPADRCKNAVIITIANDADPSAAAGRLLDSEDPAVRPGVAAAAAMLSECGDAGAWAPVLARVGDDQAVLEAAGKQVPAGTAGR